MINFQNDTDNKTEFEKVNTVWKNENVTLTEKFLLNQLFGNFFGKTVTCCQFLPKMRESKFP